MIRRIEVLSLGAALLAAAAFGDRAAFSAQPSASHLHLRWSLSSAAEFFTERQLDDPGAPRQFKLDQDKASRAGADSCADEAKRSRPARDFCKALAARLVPVLTFAFDQPGTALLDSIDIQCFRVSRHRNQLTMGFVRDNASYDVLLPGKPGLVRRTPGKVLILSQAGTVALRLWPDRESGLEEGGSLDLEIRFHFRSDTQGTADVSTGRFTLIF